MMRFGGKYAHIRACHAFHMFSSKCTTMTCNRMSSRRRRRLLPVNLYSLLLFLFTTSLPVGYSFFTPRANSINCQPPYSKSSPLQHRYGRTFLQNIRKSRICLVQVRRWISHPLFVLYVQPPPAPFPDYKPETQGLIFVPILSLINHSWEKISKPRSV